MTKSRKPAKTQMPCRLSDPEVDAALQLIQLSGEDSDEDNNNRSSKSSKTAGNHQDQEICSGMAIEDSNLDDHAFPPRKRKFRSLLDIYLKTTPIVSKKRGAAAGKLKNRRRDLMVR